jgi:hypothetical protein
MLVVIALLMIVLPVPITPRWIPTRLVPIVNVFHTGMALTVVTTLAIVTPYVMDVTVQLPQIATTVSYTPHGAQDSVHATTHMLVRNVTTV